MTGRDGPNGSAAADVKKRNKEGTGGSGGKSSAPGPSLPAPIFPPYSKSKKDGARIISLGIRALMRHALPSKTNMGETSKSHFLAKSVLITQLGLAINI